jgi:hypothetical protein
LRPKRLPDHGLLVRRGDRKSSIEAKVEHRLPVACSRRMRERLSAGQVVRLLGPL